MKTLLLAALTLAVAGCATAPDRDAVLQRADAALGASRVKTLVVSARGSGTTFGQAWVPGNAWPGLDYSALTRVYDFEAGAFREDYARSRSEPNGGGATPLAGQGEARVTGFARETWAWNGGAAGATPAPVALDQRLHDLWLTTPQGAIRAARQYGAVTGTRSIDGQALTTLSFSAPGRFSAVVFVDAAGLVPRIESTLPNAVLGDVDVVTRFSNWRDVSGIRFPMRLQQDQGGAPVLDVTAQDVQVDVAAGIAVPDAVRSAQETVAVMKVADGVWFLGGGSHNSVAVEHAEQIVLIESPLYDGRAAAVFAAANALVPGKQVRTVVVSHHHFDHAGGVRYAAAQGASLVVAEQARPWFERTLAARSRIAPDALSKAGSTPKIVAVDRHTTLRDPTRPIEIHAIDGSIHAQAFLMVWLPRERLLVEADAYTPGAPNAPAPAVANANNVNLVQNIERLNLPVDRILPLHGRVVPVAELYTAVGRAPPAR